MRPNPLFTAGSAPTEAPAAGTQLKIAARGKEDVRDLAHTATSAVVTDEVRRSHGEWCRTLDAVKETLANLERTCESAIEAHEAGVEGLIETLVGAADAEAVAAAQQTHAQAEIEIAELQEALDRHQVDLQVERDMVKDANEQLDTVRAARARAESERDEAQRVSQQIVSATESQMQAIRAEGDAQKTELALVRQQLETEKAERSRLTATFQSVQRALSFAQAGDMALDPVTPVGRSQDKSADLRSDAAPARADLQPNPVAEAQAPVIEPHPEAVEHIKRLLEEAEAMYWTDINSGRAPAEVVDRLTGILRYARDLVVGRWGSGDCDAAAVFEQQIAVLLDSKAETSFGRHLSISAFASRSESPAAQ
jgi:DNA repair exonuclease SbcCD ATPase subunit